jgi:hypothetical protein
MRDIPGLTRCSTAPARARAAASYRFHGHRSPATASAPAGRPKDQGPTKVKDGVATLRLYEPIDSWGGYWGVSALEFLDALDQLDETRRGDPSCTSTPRRRGVGGARDPQLAAQHDSASSSPSSTDRRILRELHRLRADETIMSPNSQLMIHDAWGLCVGNAVDMHSTGDLLGQISDNIAEIYADKSGGDTAEWRTTMLQGTEGWYSAQEAVDAGLASTRSPAEPAGPDNAFDLKGIGMKYAARRGARAARPGRPGDERRSGHQRARFRHVSENRASSVDA